MFKVWHLISCVLRFHEFNEVRNTRLGLLLSTFLSVTSRVSCYFSPSNTAVLQIKCSACVAIGDLWRTLLTILLVDERKGATDSKHNASYTGTNKQNSLKSVYSSKQRTEESVNTLAGHWHLLTQKRPLRYEWPPDSPTQASSMTTHSPTQRNWENNVWFKILEDKVRPT